MCGWNILIETKCAKVINYLAYQEVIYFIMYSQTLYPIQCS